MKIWLTYSPIIVFLLFIYILARWFKSQSEFRKATGINTLSPFGILFLTSRLRSEKEKSAYQKLKKESIRLFKIWGLSLLAYLLLSIAIGVVTAGKQ